MRTKSLLLSAMLLSALGSQAQVAVTVDAGNPTKTVSPDLYGIFFEDINHAADGGLYAELISNRSFEDGDNIPTWSVTSTTTVSKALVTKGLLNSAQGNALELKLKATPDQPTLLANTGYWGINAVQGRPYKLSLWAKGKYKGTIKARLTSRNGKTVYAETIVDGKLTGKWQKLTAEMTANGNDPKAKFELVFDGAGTVTLDVVSLFPPTFKNRPNGLRPDLAQLLYELHPKFVRFPGGCFVEGQESPDNAFRWERTIGPIEERVGHKNVNWGYRTSDGIGFDEYLQMAEDFGAKPLYVVNVGLWHGGLTPVDSLQPWIDECLNALEYANGPVTSKYGALRAKNGHPAPYNIEYLEIGNENNQPVAAQQSDRYYERFKLFKDAILAKYPNMHLIGNVVAWGDDNPTWDSSEPVELLDEHYYRNPSWFANAFHKYDSYQRGKHDIYVGEYAVTQGFGYMGSLEAALGEAVYMMGMENNSDVVKMASYAPIFANLNNRVWAPDMIQFTSDRVFGTPSYYVQKVMFDNIGEEKDLPIKRCAYSACFRREAGSYGKDVRGLNRLHQFDKVEIVRIDTPEHSYTSYQEMLDHVEGLLQKLELPYHILLLCGGDMSFTSSICYDFETYSAAQERWLEVSSVSNFESYQANRLHCRFRRADNKKIELCHTLNGSALALPRIVATIIENNQTPDGIRVPKVLVPYCGFEMIDDKMD